MMSVPDGLPQHVGIIMDGNRRWAKANFQPPWNGHRRGAVAAEEIVFAAQDMGVKYLTMFVWSVENWKRPKEEVNFAMDILREFFDKDFGKLVARGIRMQIVGNITAFPNDLQQRMERAERESKNNSGLVLNLCMNYGGREEIVIAARRLVEQGIGADEITETNFASQLQSANLPDIDLVIRTSGEQRLSGFMTWRTVYSELYFMDKLWPEFTPEDLKVAFQWYANRERRYGK